MKDLGWSRRKSPVQTMLILLVESGLVFLGFQVSHFCISVADMYARVLTLLTDSVLNYGCAQWPYSRLASPMLSRRIFFSFRESGQTGSIISNHLIDTYYCRQCIRL